MGSPDLGKALIAPESSGWRFEGGAGVVELRTKRFQAVATSAPASSVAFDSSGMAGFQFTVGGRDLFVYEVGQIGATETRCGPRDNFKVDIFTKRYLADMDLQDSMPSLQIGPVDNDSTVKPSRSKESRVKNIGTVCGRHDDHAFIGLKAVHFNQELVQRLLPFVMSPPQSRSPMSSHGIDFVDEDDGGCVSFSKFEEVSNPGSTDTHE